ncbi:hypothetical protein [Rhizobium fabae]|uniref:HNH endonuclease 5 domain-containing protein n=1 Tax=Rhizobium fabae TaxID=573179 RepID=A0A7W6B2X9_9HYPH|nr:hypothetical protein [Rhizobium fabae]MBB3913886.1 hypothetical protein [Rhizobium fabae]RUM16298.1 hypothetical protein EFB14_02965 [Rhizobium fabae]
MSGNDGLKITTPRVTFPAVGRCIYCGSETKKLGKEHVIPFGLAGHALVLPEASCNDCSTVTGKIEQVVLKHSFGAIRNTLGLPTRNPKDRPTELPVFKSHFQPGATEPYMNTETTLPSDLYPLHFVGLLMDHPGMISGHPLWQPLPWDFYTAANVDDFRRVNPEQDVALRIAAINPYVFAQFLAKVGHSYAVAAYGIEGFEPLLLDLIFGRTDGRFRPWIGGEKVVPPKESHGLHHISASRVKRGGYDLILVKMRFFRLFPSPIYYALAGRIRPSP